MTVGLTFLKACIDNNSQLSFRQANRLWFTADEVKQYDHIVRHLQRFGRMPAYRSLVESGINLTRADEPPEYYLRKLEDRAIITQVQATYKPLVDAMKVMDVVGIRQAISHMNRAVSEVANIDGVTTLQDQAKVVMRNYELARKNSRLVGTTLGWGAVDASTDGAMPGDVIIVVGRPSVGKSYILLHMMQQAWLAGKTPLLVSMEMTGEQLARRFLGMQAEIPPDLIRSGKLSTHGYVSMLTTVAGLDDLPPIHVIEGNFRKGTGDIDKAIQEVAPDIGYIDAGYLLTPQKGQGRTRREVITEVIEEIKEVAINRKRPLVSTVQFNRQVKRGQRGLPELADIAESDAIGQIASIVLGIQYGLAPFEFSRRLVSLLKNRDGAVHNFEVNFRLSPPDFTYNRDITDEELRGGGSAGDGDSAQPMNLDHMM